MKRIIVLGMHRGGTSMAAEMVRAWGAHAGDEKDLMRADAINPRGYWEPWPLVQLNDELLRAAGSSWFCPPEDGAAEALAGDPDFTSRARTLLASMDAHPGPWFWKDPRLSVLLPFWQRLWGEATYVVVVRDPLESATSISRRDGLPTSASLLLWQRSMSCIFRDMAADQSRIVLHYERVLEDPFNEAKRLAKALEADGRDPVGSRTLDAMARVAEPALRRSYSGQAFLESDHGTPAQEALYEHCLEAAAGKAMEFDPRAYPLYPGWRDYLRSVVDLATERRERPQRQVQATPPETPQPATSSILDSYVKSCPDAQSALDIFKGEWSSSLPTPLADRVAGTTPLFNDPRIQWWLDETDGVRDTSVLELGPLEAGHTYMLHQAGAREIVAIEGNTRAYLKCLVVKELLQLTRARFLCGDFVEWLRRESRSFEKVLASGVLYHMQDPVELISLLAGCCTKDLMLWTHYYDDAVIRGREDLSAKFQGSSVGEVGGFSHTLHRQEYQGSLGWGGFCGGSAPASAWLSRDDLFGALEHFGFGHFRIKFDEPQHPNGPAVGLIAERLR